MCKSYSCSHDHTHYGTPFLRPKAYKARVRGISPRCEIEQIHAGGTKIDPYPSQSEQYLIGGRGESPPTRYMCIEWIPFLDCFVGKEERFFGGAFAL